MVSSAEKKLLCPDISCDKKDNNLFFLLLSFVFLVQQKPSTTKDANSISFLLLPEYPQCSVEVFYQLYRYSDGKLVRSGVSSGFTPNHTVTLTDLECDTNFRLHLTTDETEVDYWVSIKTDFPSM